MSGSSPTQRALDRDQVEWFVRASFGAGRRVSDCAPMTGGGFATVWRVLLDDGEALVLKVAPPPGTPLLRYEADLTAAEARCFRLIAAGAPEVPVPRVLHHGRDPDRGEWLCTTLLPGRSLHELAGSGVDDAPARFSAGAATAALHRITGTRYGYDDARSHGATWREAFAGMLDDLLADAVDWDVPLPSPAEQIRSLPDRYAWALGEVRRPALLYFDGWDGNVLASPDAAGTLRLRGLVDGERFLFGDPLMDLVAPLLFRRVEDEQNHPFVRGYRSATTEPVTFDAAARCRLALYRLHLSLLMTVEMPSRGITPTTDPHRYHLVTTQWHHDLATLSRRSVGET